MAASKLPGETRFAEKSLGIRRAKAYSPVRTPASAALGAGNLLPVEDVAVYQAVSNLLASLQLGAILGRCPRVLNHQGGVDLVQIAVRIPIGVEIHRAVEQRHHGQGQDGQLGQEPAGHALEFGAGKPQNSHFAVL
ncbi:hypothetical protein StoSoilB13_48520 (plasmid) [Arthrobacter sp. StoSoilB13]|nr:hypothetical protein StoSoilB13_48520 [Arthrobacter sp. StoSoilB13]